MRLVGSMRKGLGRGWKGGFSVERGNGTRVGEYRVRVIVILE